MTILTILAWVRANKHLVGYTTLVLAALAGLWLVHHHGYTECQRETKTAQAAAELARTVNISAAQSKQAAFMTALLPEKSSISQKIGASHDESTPPAVFIDTIDGLYSNMR